MNSVKKHRVIVLLALIAAGFALLTPALTASPHHELTQVGNDWFGLRLVPLVQSYTHYAPFAVAVGYIYSLLAHWQVLLADALVAATIVLLAYMAARLLGAVKSAANLLSGLMLVALFSGYWQYGADSYKYGLLFVLGTVLSYLAWEQSKPSYWLLGETDRNWRLMLLSGICYALTVFTEPVFGVVILPLLYSIWKTTGTLQKATSSFGFYILPLLAHSWVWVSYFSSRSLMNEWVGSLSTHIQITFSGGLRSVLSAALLPAVVVALSLIVHANRKQANHATERWFLAIATIILAIGLPRLAVTVTPLLVLLLILLGIPTVIYKALQPRALITIGVVACGLLISALHQQAKIEDTSFNVIRQIVAQHSATPVGIYARGAGYYDSALVPSTRFYDTRVLSNGEFLIDYYRGDNEASLPAYYVIQKEASENIPARVDEYINTHYQQIYEDDSFRVLARTTNL